MLEIRNQILTLMNQSPQLNKNYNYFVDEDEEEMKWDKFGLFNPANYLDDETIEKFNKENEERGFKLMSLWPIKTPDNIVEL